ncbi:RNA-directed DNA polymerase, eukaryota, reverse transcriptase zinc-binding domain protein [Tanacetum coccineum]
MHKKLGNGANTAFWEDVAFKHKFPRLYALETCKGVNVAAKLAHIRKWIDDKRLPEVSTKTRWIKAMPIKVNVHAWKVRLDCLPTRLNISRRGMDIGSILCPICDTAVESSRHVFFNCNVAEESL